LGKTEGVLTEGGRRFSLKSILPCVENAIPRSSGGRLNSEPVRDEQGAMLSGPGDLYGLKEFAASWSSRGLAHCWKSGRSQGLWSSTTYSGSSTCGKQVEKRRFSEPSALVVAIRAHGLTSASIAGWTTPGQQVEDDLPRSDPRSAEASVPRAEQHRPDRGQDSDCEVPGPEANANPKIIWMKNSRNLVLGSNVRIDREEVQRFEFP
uniref:Ig-like domain-containing protein n=1 Tax=Macrostomum lignano TaxID=282301 RepID=A0A1I8JPL3_9PLAT